MIYYMLLSFSLVVQTTYAANSDAGEIIQLATSATDPTISSRWERAEFIEDGIFELDENHNKLCQTSDSIESTSADTCRLDVLYIGNNGQEHFGICTGFVIGQQHIATAAHCLWNPEINAWAYYVKVTCGTLTTCTYGKPIPSEAPIEGTFLTIAKGYRNATPNGVSRQFDAGVIFFPNADFPFPYVFNEDTCVPFGILPVPRTFEGSTIGYPGGMGSILRTCPLATNCMSRDSCTQRLSFDVYNCNIPRKGMIESSLDVCPGSSGGPLIGLDYFGAAVGIISHFICVRPCKVYITRILRGLIEDTAEGVNLENLLNKIPPAVHINKNVSKLY